MSRQMKIINPKWYLIADYACLQKTSLVGMTKQWVNSIDFVFIFPSVLLLTVVIDLLQHFATF